MNLTRVTLTGADDSIDASALATLSARFPFVEWGILYSLSSQGQSRFPSLDWIQSLPSGLNYAAHLCGRYVRDAVLDAHFTWLGNPRVRADLFQRVQLNFHGQFHRANAMLRPMLEQVDKDFIFQCDGVNDDVVRKVSHENARMVPLFDTSGGAGILPNGWPEAWRGIYCGYAGGLGPENVVEQLARIAEKAGGQPFWIDMERRVRSPDDSVFDMAKVERVLEACASFVTASAGRQDGSADRGAEK